MRFVVTMLAASLMAAAVPLAAQDKPVQDKPVFAGPTSTGFLLPNGWHLTPVGKHVETTDLPLNIYPLKDGKRAIVATSGFNSHNLYLIDLAEHKIIAHETSRQTWYGLAVNKAEDKIWWSGGGNGDNHTFDLKGDEFTRTSKKEVPIRKLTAAELEKLAEEMALKPSFKSGMLLDEKSDTLYVLDINNGGLTAQKPKGGEGKSAKVGGRPYDIVYGPKNRLLYVSDWAGRRVLAVDPTELTVVAKIPVGEHPNQMMLHPTDGRLFVACASSNSVHVIDTAKGIVTEVISTSLFPKAPEGSTPCALALTPDGKTLFVANADNNCVAVVDIAEENESVIKGFIPTGWYPTSLAVSINGKDLLIGVGKGLQSKANPLFTKEQLAAKEKDDVKEVARRLMPYPYIGTTMSGALSIVTIPDDKQIKEYTAQVYRNCPYSDKLLTNSPHSEKTAIPTKVGDPSPIKYVIYIIKENRTYDQVFGDLASGKNPKGNGDPSLCMFPRQVTPNHHKLAEEFVLLDNLYCNGQVSRDGHPWSTMAYHTDYIARDWHLTYSGRKGVDDDDEGNLSNGPSGYLWDSCKRAGLSYRNYGEHGKRVSDGQGGMKMEGRVPGLIGHMCPDYGIPKKKGVRVRDTDNVDVFLKEYDQFAKAGTMPRFIVMSLGEDHTDGTKIGSFTPKACVASNDLALGRLVEGVSKGPLWKETAIFVIEDDAQNGPDHVDAQRTVGLVISPFTKRKHVDSTQYSTVSLIRTMELILGLPPLSQYDAAARPMFNSFTDKPDLTEYKHTPAEIDLTAKNDKLSYGWERSNRMDFSDYDLVDDFELNEILWRAINGKDAPLPPAVRRAIAFRSLPVESGKR
ncbi:alkaline phosphatase family protein [Zavarzinella formosa]|uniref:alkaline phosphatase family protein n=1 Tax=Zavarzinella formosa TaxID=360055 RepID=UPI00037F6F8C|nr:alkaline phosphatase family protein [Zavarzinella formosa]